MEKLKKIQMEYREKMKRLREIRHKAEGNLMTDALRVERDELLPAMEKLCDDIDAEKRAIDIEIRDTPNDNDMRGGDPMAGGRLYDRAKPSEGYELRGANDSKAYRSLWGETPRNDYHWNDEEQGATFYQAVFSGRHHPGLTTRAMTEGVGSEGGFLVPTEVASEIHAVSLESEIVMPRALVQPMISNDKTIPAMDIGDHSSNLYGGFTASYSAEAGTLSQNNPKPRQIKLSCKKLYGFLRFSNELFEDIPGTGRQITEICGKGLGWYRDRYYLFGNGSGQPMGVLNSPCLVAVDKVVDQSATTIVYENLATMLSRLWSGSFANATWVAHPTCIPQLLTLTVDVGTGGAHIPVMKESNGKFTILTRPVVFSEKMKTLGTQGDIGLFDFGQYVIGLREDMRIDFSKHKFFDTDEMACRLIERHDGEPLWGESLTLEDGSTTVSPFVTLEAR